MGARYSCRIVLELARSKPSRTAFDSVNADASLTQSARSLGLSQVVMPVPPKLCDPDCLMPSFRYWHQGSREPSENTPLLAPKLDCRISRRIFWREYHKQEVRFEQNKPRRLSGT